MKKLNKIALIGIVILAALGLTGCGTTTVDLNKYITVTVDGYDTIGIASYNFDEEAFESDFFGKIKVKSKDNLDVDNAVSENSSVSKALLVTCVSEYLDENSNLKNGQKITLTWDCDDKLAKEAFGVKLKYSNIEQEVSGLKEVKEFNPFDYIKVSFSGTSPEGTASINVNKEKAEMEYIEVSADKTEELKEGDTVNVSVNAVPSELDFADRFGEKLSKTSESYTIKSLDKYITDSSQITSSMYDKMDTYLQDDLKADVAGWTYEDVKSIKLLGNYTLSLKDGMSNSDNNYVYFVYKVTLHNKPLEKDVSYYWYGYYKNVLLLADGTCSVDLSEYKVPYSDYWAGEDEVEYADGYAYYGFKDLESLFNKYILAQSDTYNYTKSFKEE